MKEVKILTFFIPSARDDESILADYEARLAAFLNDGWVIASSGGGYHDGFIILVRER